MSKSYEVRGVISRLLRYRNIRREVIRLSQEYSEYVDMEDFKQAEKILILIKALTEEEY